MKFKLTKHFFLFRRKLLFTIMRTFIFLLCTTVFGLSSDGVFSQNTKVVIDADKVVSVDEVFEIIKAQSDYRFVYRSQMFKDFPKVQLNKGTIAVRELLEKSFNTGDFDFEFISDHNIVIKEKPVQPQQIVVTGKVTDISGVPLPGVSVIEKDTNNGTYTNLDGQYEIKLSKTGATLLFVSLGFESQEILISEQKTLDVVLKESATELNEVLVTGYQTIASERATGSFAKISSEDYKGQRLNSLDAVLEGRIVGYQDGVIRGTTSMNGLTTPLYVIDGFPVEQTRYDGIYGLVENTPDINIEDIESITVLKDAAAASIYGARAANGVIVITTKKAKAGETSVSFSSNLTVSPYKYYTGNLTNASDILGFEQQWANGNPNLQATDGTASSYASSLLNNAVYTSTGMQTLLNYYAGNLSQSEFNTTMDRLGNAGYKYYDDLAEYAKRDQFYQQFNLSFGKASENNSFNASVTYKDNIYEDINSNDQSIGINLKNTAQITDWLTADIGTYVYFNNGDTQTFNALSPGYKYQAYDGLVNADGTPFTSTAESRYSMSTLQSMATYGLYNMDITPLDELGRNISNTKNFLNRTYAKLNVRFSDAFSYNAMFQYEYGTERVGQLSDKDSYAVRSKVNGLMTISPENTALFNLPYGDISFNSNQYSNAYNFRQQLNFNKIFNQVHDVTAIAGMEMRHNKSEYSNYTRYGYDNQTLTFTPVNQADLLQVYGSVFSGYLSQNDFSYEREYVNRYVSVYGNAGYTYDNRYTVTGSLRWDRSNLWGTDNKYQNKPTWSAGASWNVDNESFFNVSWIDMLKLRLSYGIGGNVAKNSAPYLTAYYNSNYNVGGLQGTVNSRPNPELSWEKTTTGNIGFDAAFFRQRLRATVDYYNKRGEDLLANSVGIPTEGWGYSTYTLNNGEMTNKGVEVSLNGTLVQTPNFTWDLGVLYAHNKNEVDYVNVEAPVYYLQLDYPSAYPRVGNDFNSIYGYKWAGLSSNGLPQVFDASGEAVSYNPADLAAIEDYGTTVPTHSGSFNTNVRYKNFSLSALFIYQLGHKMRNTFLPMFGNTYNSAARGYITNISAVNNRINNSWQQPGDEAFTDVPRVVYEYEPEFSYDLQSIYSYADINILDASNLRLSNVSLGYEIPKELAAKLRLQTIRLNFNVENVFTVAKSKDAKYLLGGFQTPNYVFGFNVNF